MTMPHLTYVGDILVGVVSDCDCPPTHTDLGDGLTLVAEHAHEAHDIVPVRGEDDMPEGVRFEDYKAWCRLFAAAPDLLAAGRAMLAAIDGSHAQVIYAAGQLHAAIAKAGLGPAGKAHE